MAGISSGGSFGTENLEHLEVARHKAKGVLGTVRDLAILRTQVAMFRDTGLLHPVQTLRAVAPKTTVDVGASSSSDVVEYIIGGETEEGHVVRLLQHAYDAFSNAEFDEGKNLLKQASFISSCKRCGRGISGINDLIEKGDLYEARRRLSALVSLIPSYYSVIEGESELRGEEGEIEAEKGSGREGEKKEEIEEVCEECRVSEILETCHWDVKCIDAVIQYAEELKAKGEKVLSDDLLNKAEEFVSL